MYIQKIAAWIILIFKVPHKSLNQIPPSRHLENQKKVWNMSKDNKCKTLCLTLNVFDTFF